MIAAHRRRHRLAWLLLAAAIPILLWFAVAARPNWPTDTTGGGQTAPFAEASP